MTAVEWFSDKTWRLKVQLENKEITVGEYGVTYVELLEQAKEIEKYQIINASIGDGLSPEHREKAERYYNEKFKQQEK